MLNTRAAAISSASRAARRISVIVPTCDRPGMLRQALASIRALEANDLGFEILVADNGEGDAARAIAEAFDAIYLRSEARGAGAARNVALRAASGEYIAFLDDDDAWLAGNIRPQLALLDQRPDLDAVVGQVIYADPDLRPYGEPYPPLNQGEGEDLLRRMLGEWFPQIGSTVARASVRELVGEFDEALLGGQDQDWLLRIARKRKLAFCEVSSLLFRGRPPGSFDELSRSRIKYGRRIFFRHALAEWKIWRSPSDFMRAYARALSHFYYYFAEAAEDRASRGDRAAALRAALQASVLIPGRAARHITEDSPLRRSLASVFGRREPATEEISS